MNRITLTLLLSTACALAACSNKTQSADNNTLTADEANSMLATNNSMMTNTAATTTVSAADQAFLTDAMKGDNSEVALGKLAQQKGAAQGVKDLGTMLVTDHGAHEATLATLAGQTGVATTDDLKDEAKTEETKLNGLSGAAFDKEFVRATVEDHKKDIAAYEKEAKGTGPVAQMAQQTLPTLKKHLETAEKLQK
jgi:putative membrane protein